jgi:hypothetical protein
MPNTISNPVTELSPWYPGQWGIQGSSAGLGFRNQSGAVCLYISTVHPLRSDNNTGASPDAPMATLQAAVTRLVTLAMPGSQIIVGAGSALIENVIVPSTAPKNCSILGMVAGGGGMSPTWRAATGAGTALTMRQEDWRISGFTFIVPATGTSILLDWSASGNGSGTMIDHNMFSTFQIANGRYAIEFQGAPYNVTICDNEFSEIGNGGTAAAITCSNSATACPLQCRIERNLFRDVNNMIVSLGSIHGFGDTVIQGNTFALSPQLATTLVIDLRGGNVGHNTVVGNYLGTSGDYSQPGGYWDNAAHAGSWIGNWTLDVAEAEATAAGTTILPPAA